MTKEEIIEKWRKKAEEYSNIIENKDSDRDDGLEAYYRESQLLSCIDDLRKLNDNSVP